MTWRLRLVKIRDTLGYTGDVAAFLTGFDDVLAVRRAIKRNRARHEAYKSKAEKQGRIPPS